MKISLLIFISEPSGFIWSPSDPYVGQTLFTYVLASPIIAVFRHLVNPSYTRYMTTRHALRGVNLGGWLIVEKWMTPSIFEGTDAVDEFTLSQTQSGRERIAHHRDMFIEESDFAWLAEHDVELLRIPFGYWLFRETEEYVSGVEKLDWAMEMAEKYHLKVLLDFHALPGSQNGNDHSGRIGDMKWFDDSVHRIESIKICLEAAARYKNSPALWGFEIINEPYFMWWKQWKLRKYYLVTYRRLMKLLPDHVYVTFSDAFRPWLLAGALWDNRRQRVAMDIHWYSFGVNWQKLPTLAAYYRIVKKRIRTLKWLQKIHPVIVGEWSMMLAQESYDKLEGQSLQAAEKDHLQQQLDAYDSALAHIYWSYKTESLGGWNYRDIVEKGLLPEVKM